MTRLWRGTRLTLGVGLLWLLVMGPRERPSVTPTRLVTAGTSIEDLADALAATTPPDVVYVDSLPPNHGVSALLAGAARAGSNGTIVTPGKTPLLRATPPKAPVVGRRSSIVVTVRGSHDDVAPVVIVDPTGTADTVQFVIGPSGISTASIAVEPTRAGAGEWTVSAAGESTAIHVWARPEKAVRVLVLTGPPSWESRYLIRALEARGAAVSVRQELGRARAVATSGIETPTRLSELEAFDVVAVVGSADLSEELMDRWMREQGGGLLLVRPVGWSGPLSRWSSFASTLSPNPGTLEWSGPPEIVPLPAAELAIDVRTLTVPRSGVPVVWSETSPDQPDEFYAAAGWIGRGRIFTSGLSTWQWAMEAGLGAEHAEYWESVVEWLAGGLRDDLSISGSAGQPHVAWTGRLTGAVPASFELLRATEPGSTPAPEPESLQPMQSPNGGRYVRFVPLALGDHALDSAGRTGVAVTVAEDRPSWVSAVLAIGSAGGEIRSVPAGSDGPSGSPLGRSSRGPWIAFLLLGGLALAGWATRRLEGLP